MEMSTSKINSNGELHPLQLRLDKVQFLADKLFEASNAGATGQTAESLTALFVTEVTVLFVETMKAYIASANMPETLRDEVVKAYLRLIETTILGGAQ